MSTTESPPDAPRVLTEDELGAHLAEKLGTAALEFVHAAGAPVALAIFALGVALQVTGAKYLSRERVSAMLREIADGLDDQDADDEPDPPPMLN